MERFVHYANIEHYRRLLAESEPDPSRAAPQEDVLSHSLRFNEPPRATNDNQIAWPLIPFLDGWYAG
jgi:hypothetical protein